MQESPHIFDVSADNFESQVVEGSRQVPVLLDFWAEWCGPCQMQLPVLKKLVDEFDGRFRLAKLDTDRQQELARAHNIRSIPTMKLYFGGEVVEEILGAQPEGTLREILSRYMQRESDQGRDAALAAWDAGHREDALAGLREVLKRDPGNHRAALDLVRLCLAAGRLDEARETLGSLPPDIRDESTAQALAGQLEFADIAGDAPDSEQLSARLEQDPSDSKARYLLAARLVTEGDHERALEQLLELLERDRAYGEDAARQAMLTVFRILGDSGELVSRFRGRMFNLLH